MDHRRGVEEWLKQESESGRESDELVNAEEVGDVLEQKAGFAKRKAEHVVSTAATSF